MFKAAKDTGYCKKQKAILEENNLKLYAISNHLAGQLVCDLNNDSRSDGFAPADCKGDPEKKRAWAVKAMKATAKAAKNMGVNTFLTKPLFRSHLYHVILQIMTGKQADKVDERTDTLVGTNTLKGHVLLVEDNELNMKIAEEFIKMNGVSMEKAWNGIEALKLFATAPADYYSLIFMDIQMPIMDGYEATRQIRQLEQDEGRERTPIVAMSANAFNEDVSKAYLAGMDDYITKPMSLQEIKKVLQSLEEKARQPEA